MIDKQFRDMIGDAAYPTEMRLLRAVAKVAAAEERERIAKRIEKALSAPTERAAMMVVRVLVKKLRASGGGA